MSVCRARLFAALAATWPPASTRTLGPWTLRDGDGGGKRVSAATASRDVTGDEIARAERAMDADRHRVLFAVGTGQVQLDRQLAERAYLVLDPTCLYHAPAADLARGTPPRVSGFSVWPPLQVQCDIWAGGGIGAARLRVMGRACRPKTALLGRADDKAASTAFVAVHDRVAMLHALEVRPALRRAGAGRTAMHHAARWAVSEGAETLAVLVTCANAAGNALYRSLGMTREDAYHYRIRP